MSQAVLRIVKAPNQWHCECGNQIEPTQECAKMGSRVLCLECLMAGLPARPAPRPLTKAQRLIQEARFIACSDIADLTHFVEDDDALLVDCLADSISQIEVELGLRSIPYHGGSYNLFPGLNSHQLDAMHSVYDEFYQSLLKEELSDKCYQDYR